MQKAVALRAGILVRTTMPRTVAVLLLLLPAAPARAHDYWLLPDTFFPSPGDTVAVRLHVGEDLVSEAERPFQKALTVRFELFAGKDTTDLATLSKEDDKPVARVALKAAGTHLIALERVPRFIALEAEKFNKYLAEEGLDAILEQRRKAGEDKQPGRERYSRYLKTFIQTGDDRDDTPRRALGQKLELVPQTNPYALKAGDRLTVRVLFEGKPLTGARVFAQRRTGDKTTTQDATTTAEGLATFKLDGAGTWQVRLVHMRRTTADKEADWESFWGSLTFGIK
jgi:uncharacterized GH25 family protein